MLSFAIKYHESVESVTADQKNDLKKSELAEEEWVIVEEVCNTLECIRKPNIISLAYYKCVSDYYRAPWEY